MKRLIRVHGKTYTPAQFVGAIKAVGDAINHQIILVYIDGVWLVYTKIIGGAITREGMWSDGPYIALRSFIDEHRELFKDFGVEVKS